MTDLTSPLLDELTSIKATIGAARDLVKDGFMPDMSMLEKRISDLCADLQAADVNEQSRCLPALASLLKSLDDCERDIRAWKESQKATGTP
jgi:hypothetical protein